MEIAGLKVLDAKRKRTITITERDCKMGNTKDPGACAAARAAVRSGFCTEARVHLGRTYLKVPRKGKTPEHWERYITPAPVRTEIVSFDRGAAFDPGTYTLRPCSPANRLGKGRGSDTSRSKPPGAKKKRRAKPHVVSGVRHRGANR